MCKIVFLYLVNTGFFTKINTYTTRRSNQRTNIKQKKVGEISPIKTRNLRDLCQ